MSLCTVPGTRPSGSLTGRLIPGLKGRACSPAPGTAPTDITGPPRSGRERPPSFRASPGLSRVLGRLTTAGLESPTALAGRTVKGRS